MKRQNWKMEEFPVTQIPESGSWAEAAATELHKAAERVANATVPLFLGEERISFEKLKEEANAAIERLTSEERIDRDRCLYIFMLDEEADPDALKEAFIAAKRRDDLKLPQDNGSLSSVLYVGSSCATEKRKHTLRSRLRQHLIKSYKGTYALSLAEWTSDLPGGMIVKGWQYSSVGQGPKGDAAARGIVLAVEDWLSAEIKPMLGRRGSRN